MLNPTNKIFVPFLPLFVLGCATTHAPKGWLEGPNDLKTDSYGGWLNLETKTKAKLAGELIAISADSIFIVNELFHAIAQSDIQSARLVVYKSNVENMGGLIFLGTLSTISNGLVAIFTAPLWIIGGNIAGAIRSFEPIIDYPKKELSRFAPFARYPQGLPSGINRNQIRIKPKDAKKPNEITIPGRQVKTVNPGTGTSIQIISKDGTQIQGKFLGFGLISDEEYEHYAESYTKSLGGIDKNIHLPSISDSVVITVSKTGRQFRGAFIGFGHQSICIRWAGRTKPVELLLASIGNIESRGKALSAETARALILENRIPVMSAVVIENRDGKMLVAIDNIAGIIVPTKK